MPINRKFKRGDVELIIGNVYRFNYRPMTANLMNFFDTRPLIVFLDYTPSARTIHGINLHFMNLQYRRKFLNAIEEFRNIGVDVNGINSMVMARLRWKYLKARPYLFGYTNVAIRQYKLSLIKEIEEVSLPEVAMEILKNPKQSFRGYVTFAKIALAITKAMKGATWAEWNKVLPTKKAYGPIKK